VLTIGAAMDAGELAKKLATEPRKLWDEGSEVYHRLKQFLANMSDEIDSMYSGVSSLPPSIKAEIICNLIGSIGTDTLITLLTRGATIAKIIPTALTKLKMLDKIKTILVRVSSAANLSKAKHLRQKLIEALFSSAGNDAKKVDRTILTLEHLTQHQLFGLAEGLIKCELAPR